MTSFCCPKCKSSTGLYVTVEGWRAVDETLKPHGVAYDTEPTDEYGCGSCGWTGLKKDMLTLDIDGEPLPKPIPGQMTL